MDDKAELMAKRDALCDRLAKETRLISAYDDNRLVKIANVLAGIAAIDMVIEHDLDAPESDGPLGFFAG